MKALSQDGAFFVLGHEACFKVVERKK